jgi:peptide/nickel transport system substrate-binding protein
VDVVKRLGVKVDYASLDWGTVVARRAQKAPPSQGGWQIFHTYFAGVDCVDPSCRILRANGERAFFGWPSSPQIEAEAAAWFDATTPDQEQALARKVNRLAFDHAIYAPLGQFLQPQAWRTSLAGVGQGPLPFFWGVCKTA